MEPPAEEIPAELPEPCLGINFARDGLSRQEWLALVAAHSDAWLVAVAFFYAVKLDSNGRARLFRQLNSQPTLYEVVTGRARPTPAPAKAGGAKRTGGSVFAEGGATGPGMGPRLPPVPFKEKEMPASANGSKHPDPRGRRLQYEDITPRLQGKFAEVSGGAPQSGVQWVVVVVLLLLATRPAAPAVPRRSCGRAPAARGGGSFASVRAFVPARARQAPPARPNAAPSPPPRPPQLYWPDDALWYLVYIDRIDVRAKTAK